MFSYQPSSWTLVDTCGHIFLQLSSSFSYQMSSWTIVDTCGHLQTYNFVGPFFVFLSTVIVDTHGHLWTLVDIYFCRFLFHFLINRQRKLQKHMSISVHKCPEVSTMTFDQKTKKRATKIYIHKCPQVSTMTVYKKTKKEPTEIYIVDTCGHLWTYVSVGPFFVFLSIVIVDTCGHVWTLMDICFCSFL